MTKQDKKLLLQDLCRRLPYGVIVQPAGSVTPHKVIGYDKGLVRVDIDVRYELENIKLYLRPLSSITEEEIIEFNNIPSTKNYTIVKDDLPWDVANYKQIDWLNAHHFDYRGLIKKELAIAVTEDNNPYK